MLQWSHNNSVVETLVSGSFLCRLISFNGATTIQLWKLECKCKHYRRSNHASMEPQQFSCGNSKTYTAIGCIENSFNGATTIQLWKRHKTGRKPRHRKTLQWSHNNSVVETTFFPRLYIWDPRFNGATTIQLWKLQPWH